MQVIQDCLVTAEGLGVRVKAANEAASPTTHAAVKIIQYGNQLSLVKSDTNFAGILVTFEHFGS